MSEDLQRQTASPVALQQSSMLKRCRNEDPESAPRIAHRHVLPNDCPSACSSDPAMGGKPAAGGRCRVGCGDTRRTLEVMLEEEDQPHRSMDSSACAVATASAPAQELFCIRVGMARRQGVALLFEIATEFRVSTCSEGFALSVALFDRCITEPKFTTLQRECYELPMVCFLLAIKFADGCPPRLVDLCRSVARSRVEARGVEVLEKAVLSALKWNIDTVTVTHLLLQAVQLLPADLRTDTWRASIPQHVDVYHAHCVSTDRRASTAAAAILGIVARAAGVAVARLASWLPEALSPPLDGRGGGALSAGQRETLECMEELARIEEKLPPGLRRISPSLLGLSPRQRAASRASTPAWG